MSNVFVFGSNEAGIHGAGAALEARLNHGAVLGKGLGHYGNSFAIPTKDGVLRTLPIGAVRSYVEYFLRYAKDNPKLTFQVTCIGCGLAGFRHEQIAPLFKDAPDNCLFDKAWQPWLPFQAKFWGTF